MSPLPNNIDVPQMPVNPADPRKRSRTGFTVIELMLAVAILGVIVYALYSVFNQTQKALRRSETNTDVAQKARAVIEIIGSEIEQAQPTRSFHISNGIPVKEINMLGGLEREYIPTEMNSPDPSILRRTNFIHNIYFYNNRTNAWQGIGYRVAYFTNGVGSLERFETNVFGHKPLSNVLTSLPPFLTNNFGRITNYNHVADGVVHLTFIPYDQRGRRLGWDTPNHVPERVGGSPRYDTNIYNVIRRRLGGAMAGSDTTDPYAATVLIEEAMPSDYDRANVQYTSAFRFSSNALPAYIEMEFGMLEPETLAQYYLMVEEENPGAANFLQRQIAKVHLFRQRIPIRTAAQ